MNICRPTPSAYESSAEAFSHPSSQAISAEVSRHAKDSRSFGEKDAEREVQRWTVTACLRRHAYFLTKSGASVPDVVNATVTDCDELIAAEEKNYLRHNRTLTDKAEAMADDFYRREAEAMVLEAKAGHCWAQTW